MIQIGYAAEMKTLVREVASDKFHCVANVKDEIKFLAVYDPSQIWVYQDPELSGTAIGNILLSLVLAHERRHLTISKRLAEIGNAKLRVAFGYGWSDGIDVGSMNAARKQSELSLSKSVEYLRDLVYSDFNRIQDAYDFFAYAAVGQMNLPEIIDETFFATHQALIEAFDLDFTSFSAARGYDPYYIE